MRYSEILSQRILEFLDEKKWNVGILAREADLPHSTINKILNHESNNPTLAIIHSIAIAFDKDLSEFFDYDAIKEVTLSDLKAVRKKKSSK